MNIHFDRVTWYSKLAAFIVVVVLPFAGFYVGKKMSDITAEAERQAAAIANTVVRPVKEKDVTDLTTKEVEQFDAAAKEYIGGQFKDTPFTLMFDFRKGDWLKLTVLSKNSELNNSALFMYKKGDTWNVKHFGKIFPELEREHPEFLINR